MNERAVKLVENDGIDLVANSQMATLIGLVGKLPPAVVQSDPRLQLALAWANIVLHRIPAAEQALALMESGLETSGLSADEIADVRAEGGVVRGVADLRSDRLAGIDEHIAPCLARRDRLRPFAVGVAATVATFAAAYHYDLDEVNRIQAWAAPYAERNRDTFNMVHGLCFTGLAHRLMLDIPAAESLLPQGPQDRQAVWRQPFLHRQAGELGAGRIALRARRSRRGRPPAGGGLQARARGRLGRLQDRPLRHRRQDQGAAGRPARGRSTTRRGYPGRARVVTEAAAGDGASTNAPASGFRRIRIPMRGRRRRTRRAAQPVDAIDEITVQFEEASAIRMLIAADDPASKELACRWAQEWVDRTASPNRPQALLRARRLLGACLSAAGRVDEAKTTIATVAAQCAQLGMLRYLVDGGPYVAATLSELQADQRSGRWRPEWPEIPPDFLDQAVNAEVAQRV